MVFKIEQIPLGWSVHYGSSVESITHRGVIYLPLAVPFFRIPIQAASGAHHSQDDLIRYAGDEQRAKEGSEMKLLVEIAIVVVVILVAVRFFRKRG